jgi:hypothetical protein
VELVIHQRLVPITLEKEEAAETVLMVVTVVQEL